MDGHMFDGLGTLINTLLGVCVATVPLAVWKLVDIGIWLAGHVSVH